MAGKKPQKRIKEKPTQLPAEPFYKRHFAHLLIFSFVFFLFANSIPNGYNLDDELVTRQHKLTSQGIKAIPEILTSPYYNDNMGYTYDYRPVVLISFAVEHQFFGDNPYLGHFVNVLLFAFICLLLYGIISSLWSSGKWFALGTVLLFAAHPVHTEVICSLKNRDELLALFFALAAFRFYLGYYDKGSVARFLLGAAMMALAYLSKLSVLSFCVIIPVALLLFRKRDTIKLAVIYIASLVPGLLINPIATVKTDLELILITVAGIVMVALLLEPGTAVIFTKRIFKQASAVIARWVADNTPQALQANDSDEKIFTVKEFFELKNWWLSGILLPVIIIAMMLHLPYLVLTGQIALGIIYFTGNRYQQWYAYILLTGSLLADLAFVSVIMPAGFQLLGLWIIINALRPQRFYYIPSIFFFILCYGSIIMLNHEDAVFPILAFLLLFSNSRWLRFAVIGMGTIKVAGTLNYMGAPTQKIALITTCILYIAYVLIKPPGKFRMQLKTVTGAALAGCFAIIILQLSTLTPEQEITLAGWQRQSALQTLSQQKTGEIARAINAPVAVVKVNSNRPLSLVESPVSYQDAFRKKLGTSLVVLLKYLKLLIIPFPLLFYYGYRIVEPVNLFSPYALSGLVVYLALAILALYNIRKNKILSFGLLAFLIGIAPFSNLLFLLPGGMGERYLLIPSIGFSIALSALIFSVCSVDKGVQYLKQTGYVRYAVGVILMLYSGVTIARNFNWKDDLTLFKHDVKNEGESFMANNLLAVHLAKDAEIPSNAEESNNMRREAIGYFKRAYSIYPKIMNVPFDIGRCYSLMNLPDSALPWFIIAHQLDSTYREIDWSIGMIYMAKQNNAAAIPYFENVMRSHQKEPDVYAWLSMAYYNAGQYEHSIEVNRMGLERNADKYSTFVNIGKAYQMIHQPDSTLFYFRAAYALNASDEKLKGAIRSMEGAR